MPIAILLAGSATRDLARSALPTSPVRPVAEAGTARARRATGLRAVLAAMLRRSAERLSPA